MRFSLRTMILAMLLGGPLLALGWWATGSGRAMTKREPSLSIPCFAERRYGGVLDDEMLMALPPEDVAKAIAGMEALAKNGFRYPFPQYGIQQDVRSGMAVSYPERR